MKPWLVLIYKVPREPSAGRVYVWRKLKQLGAVAMQDAVWVLPCSARTQEQLQWLAAEISELGGVASLWQAEQIYATDAEALKRQFAEPVEAEYRDILDALQREAPDLRALSRRYQQAQSRDHFASELAQQVRERLLAVERGSSS